MTNFEPRLNNAYLFQVQRHANGHVFFVLVTNGTCYNYKMEFYFFCLQQNHQDGLWIFHQKLFCSMKIKFPQFFQHKHGSNIIFYFGKISRNFDLRKKSWFWSMRRIIHQQNDPKFARFQGKKNWHYQIFVIAKKIEWYLHF
jgi:hypothetical protein